MTLTPSQPLTLTLDYLRQRHTRRAVGGLRILAVSTVILGLTPLMIAAMFPDFLHLFSARGVPALVCFCIFFCFGSTKFIFSFPIARSNQACALMALALVLFELLVMLACFIASRLAPSIPGFTFPLFLRIINPFSFTSLGPPLYVYFLIPIAPLAWLATAWEILQSILSERAHRSAL